MMRDAPRFRLTPAMFHILLTLVDGERHGYGIMQEVVERSGGAVCLRPGTLYRSIKQLVGAGLIVESSERLDPALDDQRRRYYHISSLGRQVIKAEAERLEQLVDLARAKHILASGIRVQGGSV